MNNDDKALPHIEFDGYQQYIYPGLTKRELFAAMAMQGLAQGASVGNILAGVDGSLAEASCILADNLIAELAKKDGK